MKIKSHLKNIFTFLIVTMLSGSMAFAQATKDPKQWYSTSGGELILSWADASKDGADATVITRFSPVVNLQYQAHYDLSKSFGFFTGVNVRNVGFIYDLPYEESTRYKARAYTIGIPVSLKLGEMKGVYLFGGYEFELPFNFKTKKFVNEDKVEKISDWFSDKTPSFYNSFFLGIQGPSGIQLKFKYYTTNFFNKDYKEADGTMPYAGFDANVFYFSLSFQILNGTHFYY
jgi:hypothetical protein